MKIGAMVESFRAGLVGGLEAAAEVGADGVQIYATSGEMHPDNMNAAARKELRKRLADLGLELAALCGDFGGHGSRTRLRTSSASRIPSTSWTWRWTWVARS
jgi:sugar phosphate isomerase/epimerase